MVIKSPKSKGSSGEREAAALLTRWAAEIGVSLDLERNLEQVRAGGADINGVPGLEIEVKRVEALSIPAWWRQITTATNKSGKHPLLMYRQNRKRWQFQTVLYTAHYPTSGGGFVAPVIATMDEANAKVWFQSFLKAKMT
jgi:hypothetical protein